MGRMKVAIGYFIKRINFSIFCFFLQIFRRGGGGGLSEFPTD